MTYSDGAWVVPHSGAYVVIGEGSSSNKKDQTFLGSGGDQSGTNGVYGLQVSTAIINPNAVVTQAVQFTGIFSGTIGAGASGGALEAGSSYAFINNNSGADYTLDAVGFEGTVVLEGANSAGPACIGLLGGAVQQSGTVSTPLLVSIQASGPRQVGGSGTITEARSLWVNEPGVGTTRRAIYSQGTARFRLGAATNVLELSNAADTLQWASNGATFTGYASNGATGVVVFDPTDSAAQRAYLQPIGAATKGLVINHNAVSPTGNLLEIQHQGTPLFAILASGEPYYANQTVGTISPAAGGAGALPATPKGYWTVSINGTNQQIPYY